MSVLGIVAEYNPFHNGHLHHLRYAIDAVSPSSVLVALSGPFTQRGETSLLSPFARAECALSFGAGAVFALPVLWTVRDAEHYAIGAVYALASLGVTHLAFGAETDDLSTLQKTADLLEDSPPLFRKALHSSLSCGKGFPAALAEAAGTFLPESFSILNCPNNILAVCYLRAIRRLGVHLVPVLVPRSGSYCTEKTDPVFPSASSVRSSLQRGNWRSALSCLPDISARAVCSAFLSGETPSQVRIDSILIDKIRSMSPSQASCLPDCNEGLDCALLNAASRAGSREELITVLTSRRYSSARISRLCTYALLGITREKLDKTELPSDLLLLGIKKNLPLTGSWKKSPVHLLTAAKWQNTADPIELAAWQLWSFFCGLPASWLFTQKL